MPLPSATREMKNRYGNVKRSIATVRSKRLSPSCQPGANRKVSTGAAMTPTRVTANRTRPNTPLTLATSSRTSSCDFCTLYSEMTGTKACENAPSAVRRRMKFGILNATRKASISGPAPKEIRYTMSRITPVTRERSVRRPTIVVLRRNPCDMRPEL